MAARTVTEELRITGGKLRDKIEELIHQGNIRSIIVKNDEGKMLGKIPLTVGVIGAAVAPVLAAVGIIGALASKLTIVVEKEEEE
ncbi:MAG: DUF4342 domain-containing protein [Candidatus Zixiibacteriota bacterium]